MVCRSVRKGGIFMNENNCSISVGEWILTMIILIIPVINVIELIYLISSHNDSIDKKNFAKAYMVVYLLFLIIFSLVGLVSIGIIS